MQNEEIEFYEHYPVATIQLNTLTDISLTRLSLLKLIEEIYSKNIESDIDHKLRDFATKNKHAECMISSQQNQLDCASHFILRLAVSDKDDLSDWWITNEVRLFSFKYKNLAIKYIEKSRDLCSNITDEDLNDKQIHSQLKFLFSNSDHNNFQRWIKEVKKVHFSLMSNMLTQNIRSTLPINGYFYLPTTSLSSLIINLYKNKLIFSINKTLSVRERIISDERINQLVKYVVSTRIYGSAVSNGKNLRGLNKDIIMTMFRNNMLPPCAMRTLKTFINKKHLKNNGRTVFSSFLQGCEVPEAQALSFIEDFEKTDTQKLKEFKYQLSHRYGSVGSRQVKNPFGCGTVIELTGSDGAEFMFGCPLKSEHNRRSILSEVYKIGLTDIEELANMDAQGCCNGLFLKLFGDPGLNEDRPIISTSPHRWAKAAWRFGNK